MWSSRSATHSALLFERPGQLLHFTLGQPQTPDQGHRLTAAALGFAVQPN